jgi:hypothetical protein
MAKSKGKGIPKRDGSGRGVGANRGRGGCTPPRGSRKGSNRK